MEQNSLESQEKHIEQAKLPDNYTLERTEADDTGLRLFTLTDQETGVQTTFAEFNSEDDAHSLMAWVGARTSRSADDYPDIYRQVHGAQNASQKLAQVFSEYGHASVGDMSPAMIFVNNLPMHQAFWMFNHTSVGGGQELSTRYVELAGCEVRPIGDFIEADDADPEQLASLEKEWQDVQEHSSQMYEKWSPILEQALRDYLEQNAPEDTKIPNSTVTARTLDVSRFWLPAGARTSMAMLSSTRSWIDLVSQLRQAENIEHQQLGLQLNTLLNIGQYEGAEDIKADLSGLTKYSEGKDTLARNLAELATHLESDPKFTSRIEAIDQQMARDSQVELLQIDDFSSYGEQLTLQYITTLYPHLDERAVLHYLDELDDNARAEIGRIILQDHMHHDLMRNPGDVRGALFVIETAQAYLRDINRHRASGRLIPALEAHNIDAIVYSGYNHSYQMQEAEYLKPHAAQWDEDMRRHYQKIYKLYENLKATDEDAASAIVNILPLAHQMKMHLSGPVTQMNYLASLRVGLGGDYGYRHLVYEMLEELRSDPYLSSMLPHLERPNPNDVTQVLGRS